MDKHKKGFNIASGPVSYATPVELDFNSIKVNDKKLDGATIQLGNLSKAFPRHGYTNKGYILKAMARHDLEEMRNISNFYYNVNGMYERVCNYFAFLYRYDWYVVPEVYDYDDLNEEKCLRDFSKILNYLDNSYIRKICGDIALEVIKNGAYYGYVVPSTTGIVLQQLPIQYCRTRYSINGFPAVEFNMKYFDTFKDTAYRLKVLKLFPSEFAKGYALYRKGLLVDDIEVSCNSDAGWYLLDPNNTVKFNFNGSDVPMFLNAIPALIDLDAAQDLDRRKQMQKLLKIIIQKLPRDKNGDLIFDVDEARDIHNSAVEMLGDAIGVDVFTTFADIDSVDLSDKNTTTSTDDLEKVERAVFNAFGISQNLFNTEGNMALEKSILNDESSVRNLLMQFSMFFNRITQAKHANSRKYSFKFYMLETTQYNYKELSKLYKEQTQLGFAKLLPQIALGQSQSFILNSIQFENNVLHLSQIMIPPLMSSTLSSEDILSNGNEAGRPEKADDEKSEKTIQNLESQS